MRPLRPSAVAALLLASIPLASAQTALPSGQYACDMSGAGGQFPLVIGNGTYTDRAGKSGTFSIKEGLITFSSGSLAGQFSKILGPGKFGLSSSPTGRFYGVCNLKP